MVKAELGDAINIFDARHTFHERIYRFVDHGNHDAVAAETGEVFYFYGGLLQLQRQFARRFIGFLGRSQAQDNLDKLHNRYGIKEVHADHLRRTLGNGGDLGDGQRGGIAGKNGMRRAQFV